MRKNERIVSPAERELVQMQKDLISWEQTEIVPILLRAGIVVGSPLWNRCLDPEYVDETLRIAKGTEECGDDVTRMMKIMFDNYNRNSPVPRSEALQYCLKYFREARTEWGGRAPVEELWALRVAYQFPRSLMQALQAGEREENIFAYKLSPDTVLEICRNIQIQQGKL